MHQRNLANALAVGLAAGCGSLVTDGLAAGFCNRLSRLDLATGSYLMDLAAGLTSELATEFEHKLAVSSSANHLR